MSEEADFQNGLRWLLTLTPNGITFKLAPCKCSHWQPLVAKLVATVIDIAVIAVK